MGFLSQWQEYGQKLEGDDWRGEKLDVGLLERMSDQQIAQMYELMAAIRERNKVSGTGDGSGEGEGIQ